MGSGFHIGMAVAAVVCLVGRAAGLGAFAGRWVFAVVFAGLCSAAYLWVHGRAVSAAVGALDDELDREIDEAVAAADAAAAARADSPTGSSIDPSAGSEPAPTS